MMKSLPFIKGREALRLVKRHCPTFVCGVDKRKQGTDLISNIGDFFNGPPHLYYWVRQYKDIKYIGFAIYHSFDPKARHDHDFEGGVIEVKPLIGCINSLSVVTMSHFQFRFRNDMTDYLSANLAVKVERGGHGLTPLDGYLRLENHLKCEDIGLIYKPSAFKFIPVTGHKFKELVSQYSQEFADNGVKWPWGWNSFEGGKRRRIRQWCRKRNLLTDGDGLIYWRPDIVFQFMRRENLRSLEKEVKEWSQL